MSQNGRPYVSSHVQVTTYSGECIQAKCFLSMDGMRTSELAPTTNYLRLLQVTLNNLVIIVQRSLVRIVVCLLIITPACTCTSISSLVTTLPLPDLFMSCSKGQK